MVGQTADLTLALVWMHTLQVSENRLTVEVVSVVDQRVLHDRVGHPVGGFAGELAPATWTRHLVLHDQHPLAARRVTFGFSTRR